MEQHRTLAFNGRCTESTVMTWMTTFRGGIGMSSGQWSESEAMESEGITTIKQPPRPDHGGTSDLSGTTPPTK